MQDFCKCKNVKFLGEWTDPLGVYGTIPLFELEDMTLEEWNNQPYGHPATEEELRGAK